MTDRVSYLAYGSNLHLARMRERSPSACPRGVVVLHGYALRFHKRGRDGSGKCNLLRTGRAMDRAYGVVYSLDRAHKPGLDLAEGFGYRQVRLAVNLGGQTTHAFSYLAFESHIDDTLTPFAWYRELVLQGALAHGLPTPYTQRIQAIPSRPGPPPPPPGAAR